MKFAKLIEEQMVPEWSSQYLQYKAGKKKIKLVTSNFPTPPNGSLNRTRSRAAAALARNSLIPDWHSSIQNKNDDAHSHTWPIPNTTSLHQRSVSAPQGTRVPGAGKPRPFSQPTAQTPVEYPQEVYWRSSGQWDTRLNGDGLRSIQPLTPLVELLPEGSLGNIPRPALPALRPASGFSVDPPLPETSIPPKPLSEPKPPVRPPLGGNRRSFVNRVSQFFGPRNPADGANVNITDAQARAAAEFHQWLAQELFRIDGFYRKQEREAVQRFDDMKEQLDILRDRFLKRHFGIAYEGDMGGVHNENLYPEPAYPSGTSSGHDRRSGSSVDLAAHRRPTWRDTFAAMGRGKQVDNRDTDVMSLSSANRDIDDTWRDYEQRRPTNDPGYRLAKSKLKHAYIEYYHRLELLKSFVQLNRHAFLKITKKFDKMSGLRTSSKFMNEHINKSYYGGSQNKLDDLVSDTEVLFARFVVPIIGAVVRMEADFCEVVRFFSKSNRKEAALRLRTKHNKSVYHSSLLRSGFYLGSSLVIGASSVWDALRIINTLPKDTKAQEMQTRTSYMLQIWGGVFLLILQALLFAINLRIWARNRINYAFIFEFANRHQLNHRQFLELPSFFSLLFSACFWFSIQDFWKELDMIHFPIIFVAIAGIILLNPMKGFYFRARLYFMATLVRVVLSGFYHVEFRDFWMGDMLCSQTYALSNMYLYFCLYSQSWNQPSMCDSSHSYTMGFLTCIPAFWRLLQCFRRYYDTRHAFPHLANSVKYALTILQYSMLGLWRQDKSNSLLRGAFISFASISTLINIFWDIVMDWSLLNPYADWSFVRDTVGFKRQWVYYFAMFMDPPLRFSWMFYIIYASDPGHSALISFLIGTGEVLRRFMWCFFRMENEHCGNVGANRAYRDPRLPYRFADEEDSTAMVASPVPRDPDVYTDPLLVTPAQPTVDIEQGHATGMRHRPRRHGPSSPAMLALEKLGRTMTNAHKNDYERMRGSDTVDEVGSSSDEEDEDEDEDSVEAEAEEFLAMTGEREQECVEEGHVGDRVGDRWAARD